jgi:predicted site-specific integrase-resolvase
MIYVTSKEASKLLGLHPNTLRHYADNGTIETYCYCRVSSPKQRENLKRQIQFMREQYPEAEVIKDIGSGLNYKRKGLKTLLGRAMRGEQLEIVVAHKDRLARFGFELIEWIIQQSCGRIVVLKQTNLSPEQELTNDLLSILHVFSCRMHELRNYKKQVRQDLSEPETKADI